MAIGGVTISLLYNYLYGASETFNIIVFIIAFIVFLIAIMFEIQAIRKDYYNYDEEELPIYSALSLYLCFVDLFIILLRLFGRKKDKIINV